MGVCDMVLSVEPSPQCLAFFANRPCVGKCALDLSRLPIVVLAYYSDHWLTSLAPKFDDVERVGPHSIRYVGKLPGSYAASSLCYMCGMK